MAVFTIDGNEVRLARFDFKGERVKGKLSTAFSQKIRDSREGPTYREWDGETPFEDLATFNAVWALLAPTADHTIDGDVVDGGGPVVCSTTRKVIRKRTESGIARKIAFTVQEKG